MKINTIELNELIILVAMAINKAGEEIIFKPHNLTIPRYLILQLLIKEKNKTLSTIKIQNKLEVSSGNMTGRIDGLEKMGLVERVPVEGDRRAYNIRITDNGIKEYKKVMKTYQNSIDQLYSGISQIDLNKLNNIFKILKNKLNNKPRI